MSATDNDKTAADGNDTAKRLRERAERLLARPAVTKDDSVLLADGRTLAYTMKAAFIPVLGQGLGLVASEPQAAVFTTAYTVTGAVMGAVAGAAASEPSSLTGTRLGPSAPRCSQIEAEPGDRKSVV